MPNCFIYNYGLGRKIEEYTKEKKNLSRFDLQKEIPILKSDENMSWLKEVNSQSLQASLLHLDEAFTKFFREKKGFPKFKSKKSNKFSFSIPQNIIIDYKKNKVSIPKFKDGINLVIDRKLNGEIRQATISQTPSGKYFISILVNTTQIIGEAQKPNIGDAIGIDVGIKDFIVMSNGEKVVNPKFFKKSLKKLKKEQRRLSRKKVGSNNRNKQRVIVARCHERVSNQRIDFLHKLSTKLVRDNQTNTFCMENLSVKNMMKNKRLSQSIGDVSWSKFVELMKHKCEWNGKNLLFIGRFDASSKTCSCCGKINRELKLKDRVWACIGCGVEHDRDVNAAINIREFAFHEKNFINIGQELSEYKPVESEESLVKKPKRSVKQESNGLGILPKPRS